MARKFVALFKGVEKPMRATEDAAGYDIKANEDVAIEPGQIALVKTGLAVQLNKGEALFLYDRSSNPRKRGMSISNSVGVIDCDYYPKEFMGQFTNNTNRTIFIKKGERIMQGVFAPVLLTDDDDNHEKGTRTGGFGSTDSVLDSAIADMEFKAENYNTNMFGSQRHG